MTTIGAFEAKTHLAELLVRVEHGEEILITRRGRPVARLCPVRDKDVAQAASAVAQLRVLRQDTTLNGLDWRALRDTGRR